MMGSFFGLMIWTIPKGDIDLLGFTTENIRNIQRKKYGTNKQQETQQ